MTKTILDDILASKRKEVAEAKQRLPLAELVQRLAKHQQERDFAAAVGFPPPGELRLIAELKRQSPSRGMIRERFDPVAIAQTYAASGAAALSVLTDAPYFGGSPDVLRDAKQFTDLPVLRKDFILDAYQVHESAWMGADAILLIAAILSPPELRALMRVATAVSLDCLVEVHTARELEQVLDTEAELIGINHRDLRSFTLQPSLSEELIPRIPKDRIVVAESGLHGHDEVQRLGRLGAHAVLIGEAFMEAPDIGAAVKRIMGW